MQITLTSKEFDEAVSLWLKAQGFTTDRYSISTRVIAGRTDSGVGARMEVTLDPVPSITAIKASDGMSNYIQVAKDTLTDMDIQIATGVTSAPRRFGQGHSDE